ncbi:MAG: helix-turn-helix transcriptional regulator [Prevotellaceae bacterium]|jgi:transcriptional regulator with XRE-family HTH domain|nr:helix-turn-helix transcriptional regulator [Prevotellaceae bacterium]
MDIVKNIFEIRKEKGVSQEVIAYALGVDTSVISNIEKRKRELKVSELEIIAKALGVDVLYLITYPHVYEKKGGEKEPVEAILQIKLQSDKKEQVLKLIFGENNLEILNK